MDQRLQKVEIDVRLIKRHLLPEADPSQQQTPPPPPPPPPPSGPPPRQPSPPKDPHPDDVLMRDVSHVSDSASSYTQSDAAKKAENTQAEGEKTIQGTDTDDLSTSLEDEEGFLDISYLQRDILPLVAGEHSDVESEEE